MRRRGEAEIGVDRGGGRGGDEGGGRGRERKEKGGRIRRVRERIGVEGVERM